jgi:ADP-ribose pyrophosphatase YjhB (NUDIX family)
MPHSHLVVRRISESADEILVAQKNLYLPPRELYEYATIARHSAQYVIPGGREAPGESPIEAAVREFYEDTGLQIPLTAARYVCTVGDSSFYETRNPSGIELGAINAALAKGTARSSKSNNMSWVSLDSVSSWFGMKTEYQYLPWVTEQVVRALQAGFSKQQIGRRAADAHQLFLEAVTQVQAIR